MQRNAEDRKIPNASLTGATSVFSTQIRRKLEFFDIIHYNNSTVGLCAARSAVWVYSHAVLIFMGGNAMIILRQGKAKSILENKETKLTVDRLYKIAEILDTKIEKLLDLNTNKIYQQEFKDQSTNYQEIQNLYQENKDVYERLIESKDEQIVFMKSLLEK